MVVVVLAAATQGAFGLVHYLRASTVLRWTRPIVVVVPTIVGLFVISWALVMLEDDLPVLAVAFAAAFVVPAAVNIPWLRGPKALPLSLAPVATKIDFADAVRRRGRAVRRLVELASPRDDDERFLAWPQRDC